MGCASDMRSNGNCGAALQDLAIAGRYLDAVPARTEHADRFHQNGARSRFQAEKIRRLALAGRNESGRFQKRDRTAGQMLFWAGHFKCRRASQKATGRYLETTAAGP